MCSTMLVLRREFDWKVQRMICVPAVAKVGCSWTRILHYWWHPLRTVHFEWGACALCCSILYYAMRCTFRTTPGRILHCWSSEQSAMSECGRMHCVCEHVIDCNWPIQRIVTLWKIHQNGMRWHAREWLVLYCNWMPRWIHCHCGYCGYIAPGAAKIRDNGDMCLLLTTSLFWLFVHEEKKQNAYVTSGADISHFF